MTRVLIVDDHPLFRDGLAGLLTTREDLDVQAVGTAEDALAAVDSDPPDVVFMDINLPGQSGIEATRRLTCSAPQVTVLVMTMVDDDDTVVAALAAGARGYVLKGADSEEILAALRTVLAGGAVLGSGLASTLLRRQTNTPAGPALGAGERLTTREREVLDLLSRGRTNSQIARQLQLSTKTVQNHVSRILDKLHADGRAHAALIARGLDDAGPTATDGAPG